MGRDSKTQSLQVEEQERMLGWWGGGGGQVGVLKEIQGGRSPRGWGLWSWEKIGLIWHRGTSSPEAGMEGW